MAETAERKTLKPGWRTTEFYVSIAGMLMPLVIDHLPPTWKGALATGAAAVYAIARGLSKIGLGR